MTEISEIIVYLISITVLILRTNIKNIRTFNRFNLRKQKHQQSVKKGKPQANLLQKVDKYNI